MTPDTPPSSMKPIEQFCDTHNACPEGREWAVANCKDMQEVWQTAKPEWVVWIATRPGVLTEKELRIFAVFCARSVEHLLTDDRSREAIDVAERFANGQATAEEIAAAREAARAAAWGARDAARDAAWAAAREAALDAAQTEQAAWLRDNTIPDFG